MYLLGDIFNAWIGDDDERELARLAQQWLAQLVQAGVAVSFIFGNHDFLVGRRFAKATGVRLLGEQAVVQVAGKRLLLLHGDTLITADKAYQEARRRMLWPPRLLLALLLFPRRLRRHKAQQMLAGVEHSDFLARRTGVDEGLVDRLLEQHSADIMVHGHTHLPGQHAAAGARERWVLPAWGDGGGWLVADDAGWRLVPAGGKAG